MYFFVVEEEGEAVSVKLFASCCCCDITGIMRQIFQLSSYRILVRSHQYYM